MKITENQHKRVVSMAIAAALLASVPASAQSTGAGAPALYRELSYADLADLALPATLIVKAQIRKQSALPPEQSPKLRPGWVRLYVEAQTEALIVGRSAIGESLTYLVDVPLNARGKVPKLKKQSVILFANPVAGHPEQLQLVDVDAQIAADPATEARVRALAAEIVKPNAPPAIAGIRDAMSVDGNLAGESETQLFLKTAGNETIALSVVRRPGMAPQWGVSWTELLDQSARPPERDTLAWYRLACFLPASLPQSAIVSQDDAARIRASEDYRFVIRQLGNCPRNRQPG